MQYAVFSAWLLSYNITYLRFVQHVVPTICSFLLLSSIPWGSVPQFVSTLPSKDMWADSNVWQLEIKLLLTFVYRKPYIFQCAFVLPLCEDDNWIIHFPLKAM